MRKISFNENWNFVDGASGGLAAMMGGGENEPKPVTLPDDCVIRTGRVNDPQLAPFGFYKGKNVEYIKNFRLPDEDAGKDVWIEFEGIYQMAYIYVNNAYASECPYGYGNYYIDITKYLNFNEENSIKVVVKNGANSGRWYTGGGIYRNVNLYIGNPLHVICEGARISTEELEADQAVMRIITPVAYTGRKVLEAAVVSQVVDAEGVVVASVKTPYTVFDQETKMIRQRLVVENPKTWDAEEPNLYFLRTVVYADGAEVDSSESCFGIRKMQLDSKKGLRINGKPVLLRGGCVHHDSGLLGAATFSNAEERRIRILKEAGYNAVRSSHYPMSKAMLEACDRLGMYVMDEFSDVWTTTKSDFDYAIRFPENWEQDVRNWVLKDYNHPSVILYSIGNEIPETGNRFDSAWGRKIIETIRAIDDTRYVMNSINIMLSVMEHMNQIFADIGAQQSAQENKEINSMMQSVGEIMQKVPMHPISSKATEESFAMLDVCGFNYAEDRYELDQTMYPDRIIVGSETSPAKLAKNWALVKKYPNVIGDFVWTAWDYLGEVGIGLTHYADEQNGGFMAQWPCRLAGCGTIDINGNRLPISYWREIVWGLRKEPYIAVRPPENYRRKIETGMWGFSDAVNSWTWPEKEKSPIEVEVYSDAEEVELLVNGKIIDRKKVGEELPCCVRFDTVFEAGEVRARAYCNGDVVETVLRTIGNERRLMVTTEQSEMIVTEEVGFVKIQLMDEEGTLDYNEQEKITVSVQGGCLMGVGNGDPLEDRNYYDSSTVLYQGKALAIVRAIQPGDIVVNVASEHYEPVSVVIKAVER